MGLAAWDLKCQLWFFGLGSAASPPALSYLASRTAARFADRLNVLIQILLTHIGLLQALVNLPRLFTIGWLHQFGLLSQVSLSLNNMLQVWWPLLLLSNELGGQLWVLLSGDVRSVADRFFVCLLNDRCIFRWVVIWVIHSGHGFILLRHCRR